MSYSQARHSLFLLFLPVLPVSQSNNNRHQAPHIFLNKKSSTIPVSSLSTSSSSSSISRRKLIQTTLSVIPSLFLLPSTIYARKQPSKPLSVSLLPLVRVYDALSDLASDVEAGTNGDVRRITKTLLKGSDVISSTKEASLWLSPSDGEEVISHGREAFEYLNQVIDYFDSTATKRKPPAEQLSFCLKAIEKAKQELNIVLNSFDPTQVQNARQTLTGAL